MLNIAHRGYTREWPGNTLEAIEAAIRLGVDAVEVDVQETGDGGFVLAHDDTIYGRRIDDLTLSEAVGLDAGEGCRVGTLEEALDLCWGEVGVVLELKEVRSIGRFLEVVKQSGEEGGGRLFRRRAVEEGEGGGVRATDGVDCGCAAW